MERKSISDIVPPDLMSEFGKLPPHIREIIVERGERLYSSEDIRLAAELARNRRGCCGNW